MYDVLDVFPHCAQPQQFMQFQDPGQQQPIQRQPVQQQPVEPQFVSETDDDALIKFD